MITLVGSAPHLGGVIGRGPGIRIAGGTTVPVLSSFHRPKGILVPVVGRDGASITVIGTVPTYADLPTLTATERGHLYVVQADELGYTWSGTAWPAAGAGFRVRGDKGDRGLGIASVTVVDDTLRMLMTDGSVETVSVPALSAAAQAALDAAGSATLAGQHRSAAAGSASAASTSATNAATSASAAAGSASTASTMANSFGLTGTATTGAPGSQAQVTVVRDGSAPTYTITITVPRGDKGAPGEISQQELETAITAVHLALVGEAPETLRTLGALADALGDDPSFATTVMGLIGEKAAIGHTHTPASIGAAAATHTHTMAQVSGLDTALAAKASIAQVNARPAFFSGTGGPPASIPGAVVGDWWLDETAMALYKITGV